MSANQFHVYLAQCLNSVLNVKAESTIRRFQTGEGPSRGLLCDCEGSNFAKVRFHLYLRILIVMLTITYKKIYDNMDTQWKYEPLSLSRYIYVCRYLHTGSTDLLIQPSATLCAAAAYSN